MSTASITHRPIAGTAVAAAFIAVLAFVGVSLAQHDSASPAPSSVVHNSTDGLNPDAHYQRPMHPGLQSGMP
jgi:hypothetical protein